MMSENRQQEYNQAIVDSLSNQYDTHYWQQLEPEGDVLEGTGVLVFDHSNRVIYLNLSQRATLSGFDIFMETFDRLQQGYRAVPFEARDRHGNRIYHTNVMVADLDRHLVCCMDSIQSKHDRMAIEEICVDTEKELVNISFDEMENFCGNII